MRPRTPYRPPVDIYTFILPTIELVAFIVMLVAFVLALYLIAPEEPLARVGVGGVGGGSHIAPPTPAMVR